jgi:hypothetical protein
MDTGFFPESNYILAATGGLGFAVVSYWLHVLEAWYATIMILSVLSITSVWFHIWRTEIAYRMDNTAALLGVFLALYDAYRRGPMALGICCESVLYVLLIFYIGFLGGCYAFDPDRLISTLFHASIHAVTAITMVLIAFFFPILPAGDFQSGRRTLRNALNQPPPGDHQS